MTINFQRTTYNSLLITLLKSNKKTIYLHTWHCDKSRRQFPKIFLSLKIYTALISQKKIAPTIPLSIPYFSTICSLRRRRRTIFKLKWKYREGRKVVPVFAASTIFRRLSVLSHPFPVECRRLLSLNWRGFWTIFRCSLIIVNIIRCCFE